MTEPLFCCCCYERHCVNIWVGHFSWNVLITLISLTSRTVARSCWNESELDYCPWNTSLPFLIPHRPPVFPPKRDQDIGTSSDQSLSRVRLCNPMNRSTPGLPVHHQLPEFTQTHVHQVSDAIQPSYPLSSPSPPAPNPSQHQSLFQWVNSSHEVAQVLEFQL